jgi:hypothetical protein
VVKRRDFFFLILLISVVNSIHTQAFASGTILGQDVLRLLLPEAVAVLPGEGFEMSSGSSVAPQCRSAYDSITWAFGQPMTEEGFRVRLTSANGVYAFFRQEEVYDPRAHGGVVSVPKVGKSVFADALVGYTMNYGSLWISAFGGAAYEERVVDGDGAAQQSLAPEVAMDLWIRAGDTAWFSANVNYVTNLGAAKANVSVINGQSVGGGAGVNAEQYSGSLRFGVRTLEFIGFALDLGPEVAESGDAESHRRHAGSFAKVNYWGTEMTVSGGVEGEVWRPDGYYASVGVFRRF